MSIAGWSAGNILEARANMPQFKGQNVTCRDGNTSGIALLGALDYILPQAHPDRPWQLPLQDVYKMDGTGTVPEGRVETGVLKPSMLAPFAHSQCHN